MVLIVDLFRFEKVMSFEREMVWWVCLIDEKIVGKRGKFALCLGFLKIRKSDTIRYCLKFFIQCLSV
jgi:hypothetical protein